MIVIITIYAYKIRFDFDFMCTILHNHIFSNLEAHVEECYLSFIKMNTFARNNARKITYN